MSVLPPKKEESFSRHREAPQKALDRRKLDINVLFLLQYYYTTRIIKYKPLNACEEIRAWGTGTTSWCSLLTTCGMVRGWAIKYSSPPTNMKICILVHVVIIPNTFIREGEEYFHYANVNMRRASEASIFFLGFPRKRKPLHNGSYEHRVPKTKNKTLFCMCDSTS